MKKLLLFSFLFVVVGFSLSINPSFAQTDSPTQSADIFITQPATVSSQVNYTLAYPGLLPDSPLYFLKALRDRVVSLLINNAVKQSQFNLLTSDKRINAATMLVAKGKDDLAITTISKSNNYFSEAITATNKAYSQNKNNAWLYGNLKTAIKKHEEVMHDMQKSLSKKHAQEYDNELNRMKNFENIVSKRT
jgi:hypothetical protein